MPDHGCTPMSDHGCTLPLAAASAVTWHLLDPAAPSLLAMMLTVAPATYAWLPSAGAAASVLATSCATGWALPRTPLTSVLVSAQLGALAFLLGQGARATGLADTAWAAAVLGAACTVSMACAVLQASRGRT